MQLTPTSVRQQKTDRRLKSTTAVVSVMSIKLKSHREINEMAMHMPNSKAMHDQLAIIMGALTKAAVAEICEIVDEGYAVLHLEISKRYKENEDLKKKLHLIESIIARGNASSQAPNVASTDAVSLSRDGTCTKHRQNNNGENVNDVGKTTPRDGYLMEREEVTFSHRCSLIMHIRMCFLY